MSSNNTALLDAAAESGVKKATENVINRAVNAAADFVQKKYKEHQVDIRTAFERYLDNASCRYNQIRTLATGTEPRSIIGDDSIYVDIGVQYHNQEIATSTVEPMLNISNNILILGSGGVGKSMLMRYLFLNTATRGDYVPVLLELRRVSNQAPGEISILELIYTCMKDFDVQLNKEQFEYSLRSGCYLFLLDGFDEVKEVLTPETAEAIQSFCAKYPKNPCIITSRPRHDIKPLETFTVLESMTLSKSQAVLLASKIWTEDEKTKEFCKQLNETLYIRHKDFAENPLLLSMMFLTFMRNNSIPNHLSDFYQKAYEALYSAHDNHDKGYYKRDFKCKNLDEGKFKLLLSRFCFQTYFDEIYEFPEKEILSYLKKSIHKLELEDMTAKDYLTDIRNAVCMIVKEGDIYRFSHRSFQTYFAACYTNKLKDEDQKELFIKVLSNDSYYNKRDYYELLIQIESERFVVNALEEGLRIIQNKTDSAPKPDIFFLQKRFRDVGIVNVDTTERINFSINNKPTYYFFNVIELFKKYIYKMNPASFDNDSAFNNIKKIKKYIIKISNSQTPKRIKRIRISFEKIDESDCLTEAECNDFYSIVNRVARTSEIRDGIRKWLHQLDVKRNNLKSK
ncbi:MAG: NACHT domain-containing protein, partial [Ruminococcaceae bacterium]|nr:NACHT domain-containing protein [Oscillospiraceae bacterium]